MCRSLSLKRYESSTAFISYDGFNKDSHYYHRKSYRIPDKANNIVENGFMRSSSVLLWGYRYTYVVAVIRNASYNEVIAASASNLVLEFILSNSTLSLCVCPREKYPRPDYQLYLAFRLQHGHYRTLVQ